MRVLNKRGGQSYTPTKPLQINGLLRAVRQESTLANQVLPQVFRAYRLR